jgi:hypothetical protein
MLKFLKPSLLKIVVALILFPGLTWLWSLKNRFIMDASFYGLPLTFFTVWGLCRPGETCSEFSSLNFGLDVVFWYLVGALLVEWFNKNRR